MNRKTRVANYLKKKASKPAKKGWYYRETLSGGYYSATAKRKTEHKLVGPGDRMPNPKEIMDSLAENPDLEMDMYGNLMVQYDVAATDDEEIELPGGFYTYEPANPYSSTATPERLIPADVRKDNLVEIAETFEPVITDIRAFLNGESIYRDIGVQYRRGILLYGPPGGGKTSMIRTILQKELPKDAIVVWLDSLPSNEMIKHIRQAEPNRLKVFVFEELVAVVENMKMERLLDFLDGEKSIDKSLIIGTTNYPERLPSNIVDRPSRFDKLYKIGDPSRTTRKSLLSHYLGRVDISDAEVDMTKGYSIAAIKEACLFARLRGVTLADGIKKIKQHKELVKSDFADQKRLGLGLCHDDEE